MIPIQELFNRIRWDSEFAKGEFVIGYFDRVEGRTLQVPLREVHFTQEDHFAFQIVDDEGEFHTVPFHRVREVYKDEELIWRREH